MQTAIMFDVDNTLTPPRQPINETMAEILKHLSVPFHVVAGSHRSLLEKQFFKPLYNFGFRGQFSAFVSNGAIHYKCDYSNDMSIELVSQFNIRQYLGETDYNFLMKVLEKTLGLQEFHLPKSLKIIGERITDRISMINFCPIGRVEQEDLEVQINRKNFSEFDRINGYRQKIMSYLNQELSTLINRRGLIITLGGQTSFDIGIIDQDKTNAIRTLLKEGTERLIFIGDALFEGGNDAAIKKFIEKWPSKTKCPVEAIQTNSWKETIEILRKYKYIS
ncbi:MAG: HAD-IIB family hydrolase [bacterium]